MDVYAEQRGIYSAVHAEHGDFHLAFVHVLQILHKDRNNVRYVNVISNLGGLR